MDAATTTARALRAEGRHPIAAIIEELVAELALYRSALCMQPEFHGTETTAILDTLVAAIVLVARRDGPDDAGARLRAAIRALRAAETNPAQENV